MKMSPTGFIKIGVKSMAEKLLEMNGISKRFPGVLALDRVSFDLKAGEVHGLLGENGAGKSTLIKILAGDYSKDEGQILINGRSAEFHSPSDSQNMGISVIYQELNTLETLSVAENIFVGNLPKKKGLGTIDWKTLNRNARIVLDRMMVKINPKRIVGDLTVHEKQIIEIAKAIYKDAKILVMDEPTAALGEKDMVSLFNIIRSLKLQGVGVIYISHRLIEIFEITDRVTVLRDGKLIGTENTKETERDRLITMMVGRELKDMYPKREVPVGDTLLEIKNLTITGIVDDISFHVRAGEIVGMFGLLGSGRQNIVRALYGIDNFDRGTITVNRKATVIDTPAKALKWKLGFMPIDRKLEGLALTLSVSNNITMANIDHLGEGYFIDKKFENDDAQRWVKDVNIKTPSLETDVHSLSGGNQQKIVLAKLLETGSKIFIMNEPTRGIDVGAKVDIYQMMENLCEKGAGIIMLSSELPEMLAMADRILVISKGKITAEYSRKEATQEKLLHSATI
jgi:ribose transport system ATP-binding protein